uniref:Cytochrome P450 n=1 Tax=Timema monikensis TaxID=170555 RepID=A0A7R9E4M4_9NEOP|nr:unnamed protein product [Timema monikensis]
MHPSEEQHRLATQVLSVEMQDCYIRVPDKKRLAFLDLLIALSEKDGSLSDADIREEVDTFMFEGHDTVSTAITWALYLIGIHKDIQDKLVEELDDIFHGSDRPATWTDLNNMKYMEMTIKEALRIYPSVPVFARETTSIVQLEKYTIPKGVEILFFPYVIHRNPKVFPEPNKFNPDNFLPDRIQSRHPFSYVPFSQRFALLEEKAIISSILRRFKLESVQPKELKILLDLILKPLDPIKIKITERL